MNASYVLGNERLKSSFDCFTSLMLIEIIFRLECVKYNTVYEADRLRLLFAHMADSLTATCAWVV
jgi:hypothetical protein